MTTPNPQGSAPDASAQGCYRMGPLFVPDPVDVVWNTAAADGTRLVAQSHGWDGLDYLTPIDQVGGRDGGLLGPQSVGPRMIDVDAAVVAPTAALLRQHIARVRRILGPQNLTGVRQPIVWQEYDHGAGQFLALVARPVGKFDPRPVRGHVEGGVAASIRFTLVAANPPWKYLSGNPQSQCTGLPNPALLGGRTYDKTFDYTYGAATNPGGEMTVTNSGDLSAYPVFTITGPADMPVIQNVTTGQAFTVNANIAAGQTVVIDARTGVITPGTVRLIGRPFTLAAGANTIRWRTLVDSYDPAASLCLSWRSTYS